MMAGMNGIVLSRTGFFLFAALTPGHRQVNQGQDGSTYHQAGCDIESQVFLAGDIFGHAGDARQDEPANTPRSEHNAIVEAK